MQRQRAAAHDPHAPGRPLDYTLIAEHPEKVREADAEISAKLDLVGKYSELQEKLAKLTAMRSQLRSEQPRYLSD